MKKRMMALLTLAMSITVSTTVVSPVWAGVFDDYTDYRNPDGTYSYYFAQGALVTLDENWYQNTIVKTGDQGATFYQKASYDAWEKEGFEGGGRLFTLGASVNSDFSELPSFEYIGFDEDTCMNYYAELPTDYQAYMEDESIRAEYDALWAEVRDVIAGIRIGTDAQPANDSISQPANDSISQPANDSASQPVNDSASQPTNDSASLAGNESALLSNEDLSASVNSFLTGGQSGAWNGIQGTGILDINEFQTDLTENEDMITESTESEDSETDIKLGMKQDPDLKWETGLQLEVDPNLELELQPEHVEMLVSLDGEEDDYYEELTLTANGEKVSSGKVRWESDHPEIAEVDEYGWVTSMWPGTATITASYGGKKTSCTVHVTQKITSDTSVIYEE